MDARPQGSPMYAALIESMTKKYQLREWIRKELWRDMNKEADWRVYGCIVLAGLAALILEFGVTAHGPGVSPDSTVYIEAARSLLAGNGFYARGESMVHYPPAYPILLAMVGLFEKHTLDAARLVNVMFFGFNTMLIGLTTYITARRSIMAMMCSVLLFLSSAPMLEVHSMAWSEPPFITFSLAAFLLLSLHIARPRTRVLVGAAICLGFAMVTRYVGVTLLMPMVACLFFLGDQPIKRRIQDSAIVLAVGCVPLAIWLIRNIAVVETATDRSFAIHLVTLSHIKNLFRTMYDFWLPIPIRGWLAIPQLALVSSLLISAVVVVQKKRSPSTKGRSVAEVYHILALLFCATYLAFLLVSVSFFDARTPIDTRGLSPIYIFLLTLSVSVCWNVARFTNNPFIWWAFVIFAFFSVCINADRAISSAITIRREGLGYTDQSWRNSESVAFVRSLPDNIRIYSNGPDAITFLTDKRAEMIPRETNPYTQILNGDFVQEMRTVCEYLDQNRAVLVYLKNVKREYLPSQEKLESACKLSARRHLSDGIIYGGKDN